MISRSSLPKETLVFECLDRYDYADSYTLLLEHPLEIELPALVVDLFRDMPRWIVWLMMLRNTIVCYTTQRDGGHAHI